MRYTQLSPVAALSVANTCSCPASHLLHPNQPSFLFAARHPCPPTPTRRRQCASSSHCPCQHKFQQVATSGNTIPGLVNRTMVICTASTHLPHAVERACHHSYGCTTRLAPAPAPTNTTATTRNAAQLTSSTPAPAALFKGPFVHFTCGPRIQLVALQIRVVAGENPVLRHWPIHRLPDLKKTHVPPCFHSHQSPSIAVTQTLATCLTPDARKGHRY